MRSRRQIEKDYKRTDLLILEVMLDVRDLLEKMRKGYKGKQKKIKGNADA